MKVRPERRELFLGAEAVKTTKEMYVGASICVSGVCLTVTAFDEETMTFGVAPETIRKTMFSRLVPGVSKVNLERAAPMNARNSGHLVQGHVDCVGEILEKYREDESLWFKIRLPAEYIASVTPKGCITVDGTSLTVCEVNQTERWFTLMLIHHTQQHVVIPLHPVGDYVNIEVDVIAKSRRGTDDGEAMKGSWRQNGGESVEARIDRLEAILERIEKKLDGFISSSSSSGGGSLEGSSRAKRTKTNDNTTSSQ